MSFQLFFEATRCLHRVNNSKAMFLWLHHSHFFKVQPDRFGIFCKLWVWTEVDSTAGVCAERPTGPSKKTKKKTDYPAASDDGVQFLSIFLGTACIFEAWNSFLKLVRLPVSLELHCPHYRKLASSHSVKDKTRQLIRTVVETSTDMI